MQVEKSDNKVVITPVGRVDINNSQELKKKLLNLYDDGYNEIVVNFNNVTSIDSSGLGKLLLFHKRLKERGGQLKIVNVNSDYVKKMFEMIHLNKVIDIEGL
ncbi:STAS domain-containing protein [Natroniella sulfidigena]|uniref:STAS domain-containing protein n=1 Tax=Natroniella sulfidigena TaxID=723921 RepID=UPI00200AC5A9|nr:STAS domain-containing protein [Natroniella sulfidigena]MCK8816786.1 STAS domain-containing protein [Natroniella sulfidigena]